MAAKSPNTKKGTLSVEVGDLSIQANLYRNYNGAPRDGALITGSVLGRTANPLIRRGTIDVFDVDITKDLTPDELAAVEAVLDIVQAWGERVLGLK